MPFILRFVQRYKPSEREAFMKLEAQFAAMEKRRADMPKGRRSQPYAGREPANTLIWECEFSTLEAAQAALEAMNADGEHESLYRRQVPYFAEAYTEIYEVLDLEA